MRVVNPEQLAVIASFLRTDPEQTAQSRSSHSVRGTFVIGGKSQRYVWLHMEEIVVDRAEPVPHWGYTQLPRFA